MLIELHMIQNHSPANLNRDDLGAPKTCYFGGYLRSRISSQCLKRSIRHSEEFKGAGLKGGIRTRRLAEHLRELAGGDEEFLQRAMNVMKELGFKSGDGKKSKAKGEEEDEQKSDESKAAIFIAESATKGMIDLLRGMKKGEEKKVGRRFAELIVEHTAVPDLALCGRMLEPAAEGKELWKKLEKNVEAALQANHAMSTHEARPEVDYFTLADDKKGEDAGAALIGEAMFNSACFYKYFSIHWEQLLKNLKEQDELAAHTVGAFLRGAALTTPTGKQNSFAAHNPPDGILVEFKSSPVSYANAFVKPVRVGERDLVGQSIAELAKYVSQYEQGYDKPDARFWFSPGGRYRLTDQENVADNPLQARCFKNFDELVQAVIKQLGYDWDQVQQAKL